MSGQTMRADALRYGAGTMGGRLAVLWFSQRPGPQTNPYLNQLVDALEPHVDVEFFSWRRALFGRYDVLHVHWPEVRLRAPSRLRRAANRCLVAALLTRLTLRRVALVRTLHNVAPHERLGTVDRWLLRWFDRRTRVWIRLNDQTVPPAPGEVVTIKHGHYADWFADLPRESPLPGRFAFVGLVRPYKGIDELLEAFAATRDESLSLYVGGRPEADAATDPLTAIGARDPRIHLQLRYLTDDELVREVTRAHLVVLPYRDLHNSGALIMALSLGRPVLVPATATTHEMACEFGEQWVLTYEGPLTARLLTDSLARTRPDELRGLPNLGSRDWPSAGVNHARAYTAAVRTGQNFSTEAR